MTSLKAVIQAGGKGTRLAPYSTVLPKALMPIGEGTVIDAMLKRFADSGVDTVYITVSKFGPLIRSYCGDGDRWGLKLVYVDEARPLGTIGPLDAIRDQLDGTFIVANSDIYADLDIAKMLDVHRTEGAVLTVVVTEQVVKIEYGVLDRNGKRVVGFREKPTEKFTVSTGIYCMEPGVMEFVPRNTPFGFDELVKRMLETQTPITAYSHPGTWIDIGRIEDLRRAQETAAAQLIGPRMTPDAMQDTPLIELGAPTLGQIEKDALCAVIDDAWLTMGERVRAFETRFAAMHGAADAIAVHSATAALQLSLQAFDLGPGDEILVPALTFVATTNVMIHVGATPVFVDVVSPTQPHIDLVDARRKLTSRTKAVMLMHFGGYMIDIAPWRAFCDQHGLLLFEDAAHAAGMPGIGDRSEAASFSFFTNKNMTTAEGGMVLVRDPDRFARTKVLRAHGMTASTLDRAKGRAVGYDVVECGHNYRLDELRAALGLVQIERLLGWNERRRELTQRYRDRFAESRPDVVVPFDAAHATSAHILPVLLPEGSDRPRVMQAMRDARVQTSMHYPPIHQFTYYRSRFPDVALAQTEAFAARELTLPLHPKLADGDVDRVVRSLAAALDR